MSRFVFRPVCSVRRWKPEIELRGYLLRCRLRFVERIELKVASGFRDVFIVPTPREMDVYTVTLLVIYPVHSHSRSHD